MEANQNRFSIRSISSAHFEIEGFENFFGLVLVEFNDSSVIYFNLFRTATARAADLDPSHPEVALMLR